MSAGVGAHKGTSCQLGPGTDLLTLGAESLLAFALSTKALYTNPESQNTHSVTDRQTDDKITPIADHTVLQYELYDRLKIHICPLKLRLAFPKLTISARV